ncbi:MAG: hypothetical protein Q8N37_03740 [bacterium]|nr:hypothetical protein [bacterium]
MKKINLITGLVLGAFVFSLFAPMVFATPPAIKEGDDIQDSLVQLRKDKEDFKNNKLQEESDKVLIAKEKNVSNRKVIEARQEKARKTKEEKRKIVLTRSIDIRVKQLENIKERVAKMPNIKEDLKTSLNNEIDGTIAELNTEKMILEAITAPEDLKAFAQELKDLFKTKRDIIKQIVDAILASKADKTIKDAEGRLAEITAKIAELKAAGQNTSAPETLLAAAQAKISIAKTKTEKEELKSVISDLKEAYKNMKSVVEKTDASTE